MLKMNLGAKIAYFGTWQIVSQDSLINGVHLSSSNILSFGEERVRLKRKNLGQRY
jgi:hypothetical protein